MAKSKKTAPAKLILEVQKREITGKKVKQLRKQGIIPGNIFGPGFTSTSICVNNKDFLGIYRFAHETGVVYINLNGETIPTLIRNLQRHPLDDNILHVDFRKIDLKQKIETTVPVEIVGESIAVSQLGGVLLKQHDHIAVSALPEEIPQHIEIDISKILELGQEIKVADLPKSTSYEIKDAPETVIVSVIAHKEESVTPETTTAAPEVITEVKTEEGESASEETPAAKPPEEKKE